MPVKKEPQHGYSTLVTIESRSNQVKAAPISANWSGGVHFAPSGDVVWYSVGNEGTAGRQSYVEAFVLDADEAKERSLGRIDLPFIAGPAVGFVKGNGCHILTVRNLLNDSKTPRLQMVLLVRDSQAFTEATQLREVGRPLFWDSIRKYFVVQQEPYRDGGRYTKSELSRSAVNCSAEKVQIEPITASRIQSVMDANASYAMSSVGDLVILTEGMPIVYRGADKLQMSPPICFDDALLFCAVESMFSSPRWSPEGHYFMLNVGFGSARVYEASTLAQVTRWDTDGPNVFSVEFLTERSALRFNENGYVAFHNW